MLSLSLNGTTATVTEHWSGLAGEFGDAAYPHVQHIHIGAMGTCPDDERRQERRRGHQHDRGRRRRTAASARRCR